MKTAYQYVKSTLRKFGGSAVKDIDRLQYDLFDNEQTRDLTEKQMGEIKKRALAALKKEEEEKIKKIEERNQKLSQEERERSPFWRMWLQK